MVLFAAAGYAGHAFLGVKILFPILVVAGLLVAPLVPAKTACSTPEREAS